MDAIRTLEAGLDDGCAEVGLDLRIAEAVRRADAGLERQPVLEPSGVVAEEGGAGRAVGGLRRHADRLGRAAKVTYLTRSRIRISGTLGPACHWILVERAGVTGDEGAGGDAARRTTPTCTASDH